jgi:hypothetical protein
MKKAAVLFLVSLVFVFVVLMGCNKKSTPAGALDEVPTPTATPQHMLEIMVQDNTVPVANLKIVVSQAQIMPLGITLTTNTAGSVTMTANYSGTWHINVEPQNLFNELNYDIVVNTDRLYTINRGVQALSIALDNGYTPNYGIDAKEIIYTITYNTGASKTYNLYIEGLDPALYSLSQTTVTNNGDTAKLYINIPDGYDISARQLTFTAHGEISPTDKIFALKETIQQTWSFDPKIDGKFYFFGIYGPGYPTSQEYDYYYSGNLNNLISCITYRTSSIVGFTPGTNITVSVDKIEYGDDGGTNLNSQPAINFYTLPQTDLTANRTVNNNFTLPTFNVWGYPSPFTTSCYGGTMSYTDSNNYNLVIIDKITGGSSSNEKTHNLIGSRITLNFTDGAKLNVKRIFNLSDGTKTKLIQSPCIKNIYTQITSYGFLYDIAKTNYTGEYVEE